MSEPRPVDHDALVGRLVAAIDYSALSIPQLAKRPPESPSLVFSGGAFRPEKFISEVGLLLYAAHGSAGEDCRVREAIHRAGAALERHARSDVILAAMVLRPEDAAELAVSHVCLTQIGLPDRDFDQAVRQLFDRGVSSVEKAPWKDLEAAWLSDKSEWAPSPQRLNWSLGRTNLVGGFDPITAGRGDLYAVTHALIYASDFGRRAVNLPRPTGNIVSEVSSALAGRIDEDDFDLAAELLMSWSYLREPCTATFRFALDTLLSVEDLVGVLPSLTLNQSALDGLDTAERHRMIFAESYHTALVMGLLAAALLRNPLPVENEDAHHRAGACDVLLELLDPTSRRPLWLDALAAVPPDERDALATLVADVGLRRAVAASEMGAVVAILQTSLTFRVQPTAAMIAASDLLQRFARSGLARSTA